VRTPRPDDDSAPMNLKQPAPRCGAAGLTQAGRIVETSPAAACLHVELGVEALRTRIKRLCSLASIYRQRRRQEIEDNRFDIISAVGEQLQTVLSRPTLPRDPMA